MTRTWHFGETPSDEFRDMYTRVLKGNIGVGTSMIIILVLFNFMDPLNINVPSLLLVQIP